MPMNLDEIDLTRSELHRSGFPHEIFTALRKQAPVWQHPLTPGCEATGGERFWVVSRYEEIRNANRRSDLFLSRSGSGLGFEGTGFMLTDLDGEAHLRQRKLISAGFTPRMTRKLEDLARQWAVSIIENALARETVEFVQDVAYQLPMHMIADVLGIPLEDRDWLFALTNDLLMCSDPEHPVPEEAQEGIAAQIFEYGQKISARKRARPEDDVLSILATIEHEGGMLNELELDAFFLLLTVAGSETTRNAIAGGLHKLLDEPAQLDALRQDPSLQKSATEEIIRWTSPVAYFKRIAAENTDLAGMQISAGDRVTLWYPSGNRDESVFENPFRFEISRKPNEHVAFGGGGPHFCLGAHLARREITILYEELLKRTAQIERTGDPAYSVLGIGNPILVSLSQLPVRLKAA
jgi:cytochrome P450